MCHALKHSYSPNRSLNALPSSVKRLLDTLKQTVTFPAGTKIFEAGDLIEHVYFPRSGLISLILTLRNQESVEVAMVGHEGMVGGMAALGMKTATVKAIVQISAQIDLIAISTLQRIREDHSIRNMCLAYNEFLLIQARISAVCNARHDVDQRLARWLLQACDQTNSRILPLKQDFLSLMLGVSRSSVSEAAAKLQARGVIRYSRGLIEILERQKLQDCCCECYDDLNELRAMTLRV